MNRVLERVFGIAAFAASWWWVFAGGAVGREIIENETLQVAWNPSQRVFEVCHKPTGRVFLRECRLAGDGISSDHADWIDAGLLTK